MVEGIFLGHYLLTKLNQEVMWRTENQLALGYNSTNLMHMVCQTKVT
jgi:hypothetical protein